jgi:hypothetical protein
MSTSFISSRASILTFVSGALALAIGLGAGCGGKVTVDVSAGGAGGSGGASTTTSMGGAPPVNECAALCAYETTCGGNTMACLSACTAAIAGPCAMWVGALGACVKANQAQLSCAPSGICESAAGSLTQCLQAQSMTDAASAISGAGGTGPNGCTMPGCGFSADGSCNCQETCNGQPRTASCSPIPGGAMCSCSFAGADLGVCFDTSGSCDPSLNCCAGGMSF